MPDDYELLEQYLRILPLSQEEERLTFARIEEILKGPLPPQARADPTWWGNQKQGIQIEMTPWMNAGWMVEKVDLTEQWVHFVRQ